MTCAMKAAASFSRRAAAALMAMVLAVALVPGATAHADQRDLSAGTMAGSALGAVELGSGHVRFVAGTSSAVGVSLMNASDISKGSAAAGAVKPTARLDIDAAGTPTLQVDLQGASVFGTVGYASDFKVYQGDSVKSETVDATVVSTMTTDSGAIVPASISFVIPEAMRGADGVYVNMYVDKMGSNPDAYIAIDYAPDTRYATGTAHVDQFGQYDVNVVVKTVAGRIEAVEVSGSNFDESFAAINQGYLDQAIAGMPGKLVGKRPSDLASQGGIDTVSGATYSSKAIIAAVRDALGVEAEVKAVSVPSSTPAPGVYSVMISNTAHQASHSLVENETASAKVTIGADGKIALSYRMVSGSAKEPLYILGVNGYYANNDVKGVLVTSGLKLATATVDGITVVTDVTMPLTGSIAAEYFNNVTMFVPAMSNLEGEVSGIYFHKGVFSVDTTVTVDWDTLKFESCPVSSLDVSGISSKTYSGSSLAPTPVVKHGSKTLRQGLDYTLSYLDSKGRAIAADKVKAAGAYSAVIAGAGSYTGSVAMPFTIAKASIAKAKFSKVKAQKYKKGKAVKPKVTVKFAGKKLKSGTDYQVKYKNNKARGKKAKAIVTGKGSFKGSKTITFAIK